MFPLFLLLYEFAANLSNDMYLPALPNIGREFGVPEGNVQRTVSFWLAGDASVQLFFGPLSDRKGRRWVMFLGGAIFLVATAGCAVAGSVTALELFRFFQGAGVCSVTVAGYASIHESYDGPTAIRIIATMGAVAVVAPMVGPFVGAIALTFWGWRATFVALFVLGLAGLVGLFFRMPETNRYPDSRALDPRNLVLTYGRILTNPTFVLTALSYGLLYSGVMAWITCSSFLLMNVYGLTAIRFGLVQVPIFLAYILGAKVVGRLIKNRNAEGAIFWGLSVSVVGAILFATLGLFCPCSVVAIVVPMALYSIGFGLASAPLNRTTLMATNENLGAATATLGLGMVGVGSLGSFLMSALFNGKATSTAAVIATMVVLAWLVNVVRLFRSANPSSIERSASTR